MDDDQKDVAIIEASALLVTLIFIILSLYSSNYALYYTTLCSSNPKGCVWPPWLTSLSALVTVLEPYTYLVGFLFVMAASVATIRLFWTGRIWVKAGLQVTEFCFFLLGLSFLAMLFFPMAPKDVYRLGFTVLVTSIMIVGPLLWAYRNRHGSLSEPT